MTNKKVVPRTGDSRALLAEFFDKNPDVQFLRVEVLDHAGIVRSQIYTKLRALEFASRGFHKGPIAPTVVCMTVGSNLVKDSAKILPEQWEPDWSSLKVCCWLPHHAAVMCYNRVLFPDKQFMDGLAYCPRAQLVRQLERAEDLKFLVGWEIELQILDNEKSGPPPKHAGMAAAGYRNKYLPVIEEIAVKLEEYGIKIQKFHSEEPWHGFYEIVLLPLPPLEAADTFVYAHEAIKGIAYNHGFHATMHPSPFESGGPRIGSHTHFSVNDTTNANKTPQVETANHFLAALLSSYPALQAFCNPQYDSYARCAASYAWSLWGHESKACTIRECADPPPTPTLRHWELRTPDAAMNPYLFLAALIATGLHGVRTKMPLTVKPWAEFHRSPTEAQRKELGIVKRCAETLSEACRELEADQVLRDEETGFGKEFVECYLRLKRQEIEEGREMTAANRRELGVKTF